MFVYMCILKTRERAISFRIVFFVLVVHCVGANEFVLILKIKMT